MFIRDFFYLRSCPLGILFIWVFGYLDSVLLGVWPKDIRPSRIVLNIGSVNSGFCSRFVLSTWILSTWEFGHMTFSYVGLCPLNVLSTLDSAYVCFGPFESLFTWAFSTWILSTWESGHMTFCPHRIVSTIGSVNSRFCSVLVQSTWD